MHLIDPGVTSTLIASGVGMLMVRAGASKHLLECGSPPSGGGRARTGRINDERKGRTK